MSNSPTLIHLYNGSPAAQPGYLNVGWQQSAQYQTSLTVNGVLVSFTATNVSAQQIIALGQQGARILNTSYGVLATDDGALLIYNSSSPGTFTMPNVSARLTWKVAIINIGTGTLTVSPNGLNLNGSNSSAQLATGAGTVVSTDGSNYFGPIPPTETLNGCLGITIDGGGSTPSTGSKGYLQIPYDCVINSWTMLANAVGSAQITVKSCSYAGFPTTSSIVGSAPPNISSAQNATSSTLTGWTTILAKGSVLEFNLDSVNVAARIVLQLQVTRSD